MRVVEVRARVAARGLDADLAVAPGTVVALVGLPRTAGAAADDASDLAGADDLGDLDRPLATAAD